MCIIIKKEKFSFYFKGTPLFCEIISHSCSQKVHNTFSKLVYMLQNNNISVVHDRIRGGL